MSQSLDSTRANSLAPSDATTVLSILSSTDLGDTGSLFRAPKAANQPSNVTNTRPKRNQHQAQLSFNKVINCSYIRFT